MRRIIGCILIVVLIIGLFLFAPTDYSHKLKSGDYTDKTKTLYGPDSPWINIDKKTQRLSYTKSLLSSDMSYGKYTIKNNIINFTDYAHQEAKNYQIKIRWDGSLEYNGVILRYVKVK